MRYSTTPLQYFGLVLMLTGIFGAIWVAPAWLAELGLCLLLMATGFGIIGMVGARQELGKATSLRGIWKELRRKSD